MLTGLTRPDEGDGSVAGFDLIREMPRIKKAIGVVPETSNLFDELSALFSMIFLCGVFIPLASVPEALRPIAYLLPLTYAVDGLREALTGTGTLPGFLNLFALGIFAAGFYLLSVRVLERSVG